MTNAALDAFNEGNLVLATETAINAVKTDPTDEKSRQLLSEMLCFLGDLERADKHVKVLLNQHPDLTHHLLLFRALLQGESARNQCFSEGRVPEFPEPPPAYARQSLEALMLFRDENKDNVSLAFKGDTEIEAPPNGACNGTPFQSFRDCDDILANVFEMITTNGDYYWVPFSQLKEVHFDPVQNPRDMLWRPAKFMTSTDEELLPAFFPMTYHDTCSSEDDQIRLGRSGDWNVKKGVLRGAGHRCFQIDGETVPMFEIESLVFEK